MSRKVNWSENERVRIASVISKLPGSCKPWIVGSIALRRELGTPYRDIDILVGGTTNARLQSSVVAAAAIKKFPYKITPKGGVQLGSKQPIVDVWAGDLQQYFDGLPWPLVGIAFSWFTDERKTTQAFEDAVASCTVDVDPTANKITDEKYVAAKTALLAKRTGFRLTPRANDFIEKYTDDVNGILQKYQAGAHTPSPQRTITERLSDLIRENLAPAIDPTQPSGFAAQPQPQQSNVGAYAPYPSLPTFGDLQRYTWTWDERPRPTQTRGNNDWSAWNVFSTPTPSQ